MSQIHKFKFIYKFRVILTSRSKLRIYVQKILILCSREDYKLSRKLQSLTDHQMLEITRNDKLDIITEHIKKNMSKPYWQSAKRYNQRARKETLEPVLEVFRRNTILSDFGKNRIAKFFFANS